MIVFTAYDWRAYIDVHYGGTYPEKMVKAETTRKVFKLEFWIYIYRLDLCELYPINENSNLKTMREV